MGYIVQYCCHCFPLCLGLCCRFSFNYEDLKNNNKHTYIDSDSI